MAKVLRSLYFTPSLPGSFSGARALLKEAKKIDKNIKLKDVKDFLSGEDTYTLHKPIQYKFKKLKTRAVARNQYWQIDLSDLTKYSSYNDDHKFILFIIDVYTRYLWLYPIKNKKPESVSQALEGLILGEGVQPAYLWCDQGKEFISGKMKKLVTDLHIGVINTYGESKAAIVERVQRTLKTRLHRYFTFSGSYRYIDVLQKLADSYNNTRHSSIGMTPASLYHGKISKTPTKVKNLHSKIKDQRLTTGCYVRVNRTRKTFAKGYHRGWSNELFKLYKISKRHGIPVFYLMDLNSEKIKGGLYENEIQYVKVPKNKAYKIEKILKTVGKGRKKKYLVKWEGYPSSFNSYIDAKDLVTS